MLRPLPASLLPALWMSGCGGAVADPPVARGDSGTSSTACNGHEVLCERRLDEVTLPGTHNSMSNADAGWVFPNQQHGLTRQLEDGIRALMLDTHDLDGEPMLCHTFCELGSQPLSEGLEEIATFLDEHPREVVLIIFQDGISVADTVAVFEEVGLDDEVWTWSDSDAPLPTLGALIEADQRLIVSAESSAPPPAWYHHAWDLVADTPYSFDSTDAFSCAAYRGSEESPLFLMNHWLSVPLPTEEGAREANAADVLGARARQCEAERDRRITFLAVDFYNHGDLFSVVDALNGVP